MTFLILLFPHLASAQGYSGKACIGHGNSQLKLMISKGEISKVTGAGYAFYEKWGTSLLAPSGLKPKTSSATDDPEAEDSAADAADLWTCMYSAYRLQDNDSTTAWCEGKPDAGLGEIVMAQVDQIQSVKIWTGYGKSPATFQSNNRPRKVKITVLEGAMMGFSTSEENSIEAKRLGTGETELKDINGYQPLPLPNFKVSDTNKKIFIAVEIISVYLGNKFNDSCISEIKSF